MAGRCTRSGARTTPGSSPSNSATTRGMSSGSTTTSTHRPETPRPAWTAYLLARGRCGDEFQDASRRQVLLVDPDAEGGERVLDGVHDRGRCDDHATFAHATEIDVSVERHRLEVLDLDAGNVTGGRHQVIHERGRLEAAVLAAVERGLDLEPGVRVGTELPGCGPPRDLADGDRAGRVAADPDVAVGDQQVLRAGLHEVRREIEHLGLELASARSEERRVGKE